MPKARKIDTKDEKARKRRRLLAIIGGTAVGGAALIPIINKLRQAAASVPSRPRPNERITVPSGGGGGAYSRTASDRLRSYFMKDDNKVDPRSIVAATGGIGTALLGTRYGQRAADIFGGAVPSAVSTLHHRYFNKNILRDVLRDAGGKQKLILHDMAEAISKARVSRSVPKAVVKDLLNNYGAAEFAGAAKKYGLKGIRSKQDLKDMLSSDLATARARGNAVRELISVSKGKGNPRARLSAATHASINKHIPKRQQRKIMGQNLDETVAYRAGKARGHGRHVAMGLPMGATLLAIPGLTRALRRNTNVLSGGSN